MWREDEQFFSQYVLGDLLNLILKPVSDANNISILKARERLMVFSYSSTYAQ